MPREHHKRPWIRQSEVSKQNQYDASLEGGMTASGKGYGHAKKLFDNFQNICNELDKCAQAYHKKAHTITPDTTLHDMIDKIVQFGETVADRGLPAPPMTVQEQKSHHDALTKVRNYLAECVVEAEGLVDYLNTALKHVDGIISTF